MPEWASEVGLDLWNLPKLDSDVDRLRKHNDELEQQTRVTMNRLNAKLAIVDELYNGNLTLRDAVVRFRNLNRSNPKFVEQARLNRPNCSDDDCQFWNIIDCARNSAGRYPDEDRFVVRLTEEIRILKERGEAKIGD